MNKTTLQKIHQQQITNYGNNDQNTIAIVQVLGGIDNILTNYLKHPNIALHQREIHQIHDIITSPQPNNKPFSTIQINNPYSTNNNLEDDQSLQNQSKLIIELDPHNNYLSSIFGTKTSIKIINICHHKLTLSSLFISIMYLLTCMMIDRQVYLFSFVFLSSIFGIPCLSIWILSVNKRVFKFLMVSFDFWIKCIYAIVLVISTLSYQLIFKNNIHYITLEILQSILFQIGLLCTVVVIGALDGVEINKNFKILSSGFSAFFYLFFSFYYQFVHMSYSDGDDSIVKISKNLRFSLLSLMINAYRVIGLYLAKQSYATYRGKGIHATFVNIKPKLKWIEKETKTVVIEPEVSQSTENDDGVLDVRKYLPKQGTTTFTCTSTRDTPNTPGAPASYHMYQSVDIGDNQLEEVLEEVLRLSSPDDDNHMACELKTWLNLNGLEQYLVNFVTNGYENLEYVKDITDRKELVAIGIRNEYHQDKLMELIVGLGNDDNNLANTLGNEGNNDDLEEWLLLNGFKCYLDNFVLNGYNSLDSIKGINDVQKLMDIGVKIKDQHRLMGLIERERNGDMHVITSIPSNVSLK